MYTHSWIESNKAVKTWVHFREISSVNDGRTEVKNTLKNSWARKQLWCSAYYAYHIKWSNDREEKPTKSEEPKPAHGQWQIANLKNGNAHTKGKTNSQAALTTKAATKFFIFHLPTVLTCFSRFLALSPSIGLYLSFCRFLHAEHLINIYYDHMNYFSFFLPFSNYTNFTHPIRPQW